MAGQVLIEELDYLPDEVDDMDPQIAAVVIEKSLPRPRAGNALCSPFQAGREHEELIALQIGVSRDAWHGGSGA